MFAVFCPRPEQKRKGWARRRFYRKGSAPTVAYICVGSSGFYQISCEFCAGRLPLERIKAAAGREATRLVVPEGFHFPENCGLAAYDPAPARAKALLKLLVSFITQPGTDRTRLCIGVVDLGGRMPDCLLTLLPLAREIAVFTGRPGVYRPVCDNALRAFGALVSVTDDPETPTRCGIVFAPFGLPPMVRFFEKTLVFSGESGQVPNARVISCAEAQLPAEFEQAMPPGTDRDQFAAAVAERCDIL